MVIKQFESKTTQVLFPDGSYASKQQGKDWIKVASNDPSRKTSVESNAQTGDITIGKDDFVYISMKSNSIIAEHSCLTSIETQMPKGCQITAPESATIVFKASGEQEIIISKHFRVERKFENGVTSSIQVLKVRKAYYSND